MPSHGRGRTHVNPLDGKRIPNLVLTFHHFADSFRALSHRRVSSSDYSISERARRTPSAFENADEIPGDTLKALLIRRRIVGKIKRSTMLPILPTRPWPTWQEDVRPSAAALRLDLPDRVLAAGRIADLM